MRSASSATRRKPCWWRPRARAPRQAVPVGRLSCWQMRWSATRMIGEVRQPIPAEPGQIERFDCEYRRNGTANLFVFLDVNRPWRKVKVTERRAAEDFAACMRELTDVHCSQAEARWYCALSGIPG